MLAGVCALTDHSEIITHSVLQRLQKCTERTEHTFRYSVRRSLLFEVQYFPFVLNFMSVINWNRKAFCIIVLSVSVFHLRVFVSPSVCEAQSEELIDGQGGNLSLCSSDKEKKAYSLTQYPHSVVVGRDNSGPKDSTYHFTTCYCSVYTIAVFHEC